MSLPPASLALAHAPRLGGQGGSKREKGGDSLSFCEAWPNAASQGGRTELSPGEGVGTDLLGDSRYLHGDLRGLTSLSVKYTLYFLAEISAIAPGILSLGLRHCRPLFQC